MFLRQELLVLTQKVYNVDYQIIFGGGDPDLLYTPF